MLSPYDYVQIVTDDNWGLVKIVPKGSNSQINFTNLSSENTEVKNNKLPNIPHSIKESEILKLPTKINDDVINFNLIDKQLLEPIKGSYNWEEQNSLKEPKYIVKTFPSQITLAEISQELLINNENFGNLSSHIGTKHRGDVLVGFGK